MPQIQRGVNSVAISKANTAVKKHITFDKVFDGVPTVIAIPNTTVPEKCFVSAINFSTTGFDLYVTRTNTNDTSVVWIAVYI